MNILSFNNNSISFAPKFGARPPKQLKQLASDVVELSTKAVETMPTKLELTQVEQEFYELYSQLVRVRMDVQVQKNNLRDFYSTQDKGDYKELKKLQRKLQAKVTRFAEEHSSNEIDLVDDVYSKKKYNRYAPKILKAKTIAELEQVEQLMSESALYCGARKMLAKLAEQKRRTLLNH